MKRRVYFTSLATLALLLAPAPLRAGADRKADQLPTAKDVAEENEEPTEIRHERAQSSRTFRVGKAETRRSGDVTVNAMATLQNGASILGSTSRSGQSLLIHTSELASEDQARLEEDLNVMTHLLDKATEGESPRGPSAMGIDLVFGGGSGSVRSLYLEGYGAVFMVKVGYPLLAPPEAEAGTASETESESETAWEQARQELYGIPRGPDPLMALGWAPQHPEEQDYHPEKVDQLRESLLEAIKSATNIRQLKPDDSVTVCVLGAPTTSVQVRGHDSAKRAPRKLELKARATASGEAYVIGPGHVGSPGVMTLKARKADIDSFARSDITSEQFRDRIQSQVYVGAPGSWSAGNAFIWSGH